MPAPTNRTPIHNDSKKTNEGNSKLPIICCLETLKLGGLMMFHIENIKLLLHPSIDEQANLNIINIPFQIKYTFHRSIIQAAFLLKNAKNKK